LTIVGQDNISAGDVWLGGNTVSGRREFFSDNPYVYTSYGTADTAMQLNARFGNEEVIALMDGLNVIAQRRHDPSSHTWKVNLDAIRKGRVTVPNFNELFL